MSVQKLNVTDTQLHHRLIWASPNTKSSTVLYVLPNPHVLSLCINKSPLTALAAPQIAMCRNKKQSDPF